MNIKTHLKFLESTLFDKVWVSTKINNFLTNDITRIVGWFMILLSNLVIYYISPNNQSLKTAFRIPNYNKEYGWYFKNIKYHTVYKYLTYLIILLDVMFFFYLYKKLDILYNIHPSIFIILAIILISVINKIYKSKPKIKNIGKFNPIPEYLLNKKNRIIFHIILLAIFIINFAVEYKLGKVDVNTTNQIFKRFGGFTNDMTLFQKSQFISGWSRVLGFLIQIGLFISSIFFFVCKYNFPESLEI